MELVDTKVDEMELGDWKVYSVLDQRWVAEGHNVNQHEAHAEACRAVAELKEKLGDPPNDLVWLYKL